MHFDQWCLRHILHIPYTAHISNEAVRHRTNQNPVTSLITLHKQSRHLHRVISRELSHHKIISISLDGPGSIPSNSTSNHTTWASTRRGSGHRIAQTGVNLWRWLCSLNGAPPDDDADDDDDDADDDDDDDDADDDDDDDDEIHLL